MKKESPTSLIRLVLNHPDLFYPQDWYYSEDFAYEPAGNIRSAASIASFYVQSLRLSWYYGWLEKDYWWTNDTDNSGNRIYVGGYALGRRRGLQIHRYIKNPAVQELGESELERLRSR